VGVALANGKVGILDLNNGDVKTFKAHEYEVWTVMFSSSQRDILMSGSDDSSKPTNSKFVHFILGMGLVFVVL
jgi:WD40 repeat protein